MQRFLSREAKYGILGKSGESHVYQEATIWYIYVNGNTPAFETQ